jgi:hypothetical protein
MIESTAQRIDLDSLCNTTFQCGLWSSATKTICYDWDGKMNGSSWFAMMWWKFASKNLAPSHR